MDPSPDQPKPSIAEATEGQVGKELRVRDFVDKLKELKAHPREGARWQARTYYEDQPIPGYPMSPNPVHHVEGKTEVSLLAATVRPEEPRVYGGYREGEDIVQRLDITRDPRGELVGVGNLIEYTKIYRDPQPLTSEYDIYHKRTRIGEGVTLRMNGDVEVSDVMNEAHIDEPSRRSPERSYLEQRELYDKNDPKGKEIVKRIYEDLDASVDHSAANIPPAQAAPAA